MADRAIADASYVEIINRKKRVACDLRACAYFFEQKSVYIISAMSGGYEVGTPSVLPEEVSAEELGRIMCDQLLQFDTKTLQVSTFAR